MSVYFFYSYYFDLLHVYTVRPIIACFGMFIGELIVYPWSGVRRRRPSVFHNAQTSSFKKPLGRSKPHFMWSLLG